RRVLREDRRLEEHVHLLEERRDGGRGCGPVPAGEDVGLQQIGALIVRHARLVKGAPGDEDQDGRQDPRDGGRPWAREKRRGARGVDGPVPAPPRDQDDPDEDQDRERRCQERGERRADQWPFRQSTMYCAPAGKRASLASSGRSADSTRGKRKRKSVRIT